MSDFSEVQRRLADGSRIFEIGAAVQAELAAQKDRLILWIPVWLASGIGIYFALPFEPPLYLGIGGALIAVALWAALWPLRESGWRGYASWLLMGLITLVLLGFAGAQLRTATVATPMLAKALGPVEVEGRIIGIDRLEEGQGTRLILDRLAIEKLTPEKTPARIRLKIRQDGSFSIGDRVSVLAGLNPPSAPVEPGAFDFQRYAFYQKLGAFGFSYRMPEVIEAGAPRGLGQWLENLRQKVRLQIEQGLPYPESAVVTALMTGERTGISEEDWEAMRASGLAHMLAISGLHVGLVASVIFIFVRTLLAAFPAAALYLPIKKYAAFAALAAAFSYMMLVGATIPTLRAMLMTGIVLLAIMLDRVPFSLRLVAIAAGIILIILPESLLSASFQMSFAAVTALIFFYELIRKRLSQWYRQAGFVRRFALYFLGVCMTTVVATLATGPLSLFHFQQFAVYSVPANLFAVPLMAFIVMPAAVVSYMLMLLGLEDIALNVAGLGVRAILAIAHGTMALPGSTWTPAAMPAAAMLCLVAAALWVILWRGRAWVLAILPIIAMAILIYSHQYPDILVSSSGKLVALRDRQGQLWLSTRRNDRFDAENWARRYGNDPDALPRWSENEAITCGEEGCRTLWNGRRVAISHHMAAQAEDCAWADIVISSEPIRAKPCPAKIKIGYFDLWRNGAHAIWPNGEVKSVKSVRGVRPWAVSNRR